MGLSPNDVRSYEFSAKMRGYDKEEVDNFLEQVAQALEAVKQENINLSMELDTLRAQVSNLKQNEEIIKSAAIDARRNADLTIGNAKKEAQAIIQKAHEETERIAGDRVKKIQDIEQQIKRSEQNRKNYLGKLRTLVSSHLDLVEKESEAEVREVLSTATESPDDISVTESEDVTSDKREIIAEVPKEERSDVEEELRSTVQEEEAPADSAPETGDEKLEGLVENGDPELAEALRKFDEVKSAHPPYLTDKDESEPIPSLASPNKKWVETTARAEEPPPEFIAKKAGEAGPAPETTPPQASAPPPPPTPEPTIPQASAPPPPPIPEPTPPQASAPPPDPTLQVRETHKGDDVESNSIPEDDHNVQASRTGKVDVEKEFDEIAAKFNEEMDKAENKNS